MGNVKKSCFNLSVLLTSAAAILSANQGDYQCDLNETMVDGCFSESICNLPTCHFFVRGDVLYWTPRITGLELNFGTTEISEDISSCTQILTTNEVDLDPHFHWNSGYRVGVGYEGGKWGAEALWTHFHSDGKRSNHNDSSITNCGKVKIKFDQIDLALSYSSDLGCSFTLKPFIGVRATRIHEHLNAHSFTEISLFESSAGVLETRTFDDKQKYWGVGPLFGVEGDWEIGCGFGLYATVAASLLYGDYDIHFDDSDIFTSPVSKQIFSLNRRHVHAFDYNMDLALGVTWKMFNCDRYDLSMKLGFEQHQYFNQNRLCVGRGDVSFTGGVFSLELGF